MSFRSFSKFNINTFPAIITNYGVCVITGTLYAGFQKVNEQADFDSDWFYTAAFLGLVFVTAFYLMARTTQLRGVAVATVASKMSLAIPVIFSLFIFKIESNALDTLNFIGIALAFVAILMVSKKQRTHQEKKPLSFKYFALPLTVFIMGGVVDTGLNYVNHSMLTEEIAVIFPIFIFSFAFICGLALAIFQKIRFRWKDILGGIYLGVPNFFSIFFQLKALSAFNNNGALLYPSLNIGIIIFSTLMAIVFFREKLSRTNYLGVGLAVVVIILLSHQEIANNL